MRFNLVPRLTSSDCRCDIYVRVIWADKRPSCKLPACSLWVYTLLLGLIRFCSVNNCFLTCCGTIASWFPLASQKELKDKAAVQQWTSEFMLFFHRLYQACEKIKIAEAVNTEKYFIFSEPGKLETRFYLVARTSCNWTKNIIPKFLK